ncbi:MAG: helix-turn-helix domain-containing protein [Lachnospiraceae bacterium]|nr:helix-turn-helix domain-containing protein [Lachnospiraceae bacterium]
MLLGAVAGDHEALEEILVMYAPLIEKHCYVDGILDEDLRQYIWMHIALNINKFPV